jgi:EmrB/QacA subfamily drug resistance transporter
MNAPVRETQEQLTPEPRRWKALAAICMAQFMLILDLSVINVALPSLSADVDLTRTGFTWVISGFVLFFGGLLLLGGRLADIFGARAVMLTGLFVFSVASLACGLAPSGTVLIAGRVVQGIGAALLSPAALRAITSIFHGEERNRALSVWASLGGLGVATGVLVGGILTSGPGWRWVFFINVPVGALLLTVIPLVVPRRRVDGVDRGIDALGAIIATAATGTLIYGMVNAGNVGWNDPGTIVPIATGLILYALFAVVERSVAVPLLRLGTLLHRSTATGAFLMFVASGIAVSDFFVSSQYLQHLRGLSAFETGLLFLPAALAVMVGAIASGRLVGRVGPRPIAVVGLAMAAVGNALLMGVSTDRSVLVDALPGIVLFAVGTGPLFVAATTTALGRVAPHEAGLVSGIIYTFNQLGAAILVAVASTVAVAGLTSTPSIQGFSDAFTVLAAVATLGGLLSLALVPPRGRQAANAMAAR